MLTDEYATFLASKRRDWSGCGIPIEPAQLPQSLFPFQAALTAWALKKGRAAIFSTTGTGKSRMAATWAAHIPGRVLVVTPLCVAPQMITEAATVGVVIAPYGGGAQIEVINYERLHHVAPSDYAGVVLDESSRIKAYDGKTRQRVIAMFADTPYRLCCTATPAPNDIAELANHCEFLGIMTRVEMLATFFVHDENGWRLKGHAHEAFYRWLVSWGMCLRLPSDLEFSDDGFVLPPLNVEDVIVRGGGSGEYLFPGMESDGLRGALRARRASISDRLEATRKLVESQPGQWIIWCGLNAEQDGITAILGEQAVSVAGRDSEQDKEAKLRAFLDGRARVLVSKVLIAGFGLNLQRCSQMVFLGLSYSWEQYFQAIRRCWRFGQLAPVRVYLVISEGEMGVADAVRAKEAEAERMAEGLLAAVRETEMEAINMTMRERIVTERETASGDGWTLHLGDCVDVMREIPEASVDFSVYSPPFQALYTYTNSERDIGNCATREEFLAHYAYSVREMLRVTKPGRLSAVHIAPVATTLASHGIIGFSDLRGAVIELFVREGWTWQGEICIDIDPQAVAIRTHAKGLLFVQLRKDASWLRPAMADYIEIFRTPGENAVAIHPDITNDDWIEWARPIWYGISRSDTLNVREARADDDDRHICPLQLGTIERCVRLWSNPGELVLSPFAGIGSEGYEAVRLGRRFLGIELKREYFEAAGVNMRRAETDATAQGRLFEASR